MAIFEEHGVLSYKNKDGDIYKLYPVTKKDEVIGLNESLQCFVNGDTVVGMSQNSVKLGGRQASEYALSEEVVYFSDEESESVVEFFDTDILPLTGKITTLFADKDKKTPIFPRTKLNAVSDNDGVGLDAVLHTLKATTQVKHISRSAILLANNWENDTQTISLDCASENNTIIVGSNPDNNDIYTECKIICVAQGKQTLTFTCESVPETNLLVNIIVLD